MRRELTVFLKTPDGEGRLYVTDYFPEGNPWLHIDSHVGRGEDGSNNLIKHTKLWLRNKNLKTKKKKPYVYVILTPEIKKDALFFIAPEVEL